MHRRSIMALVATATVALIVTPTLSARGPKIQDPPCTVAAGTVSASGLPTDQVINFMITDAHGTTGWVLGFTLDGKWSVNVPAASGPTTYEFVSRTYGKDGSKYNVFASCAI